MKDANHHHLGPLEYGTIRYILILKSYVCLLIGLNSKTDDVRIFLKRDFRFWSQLELINFQLLGKAKWCVYSINKDSNINNKNTHTHTHTHMYIYFIYIYFIYICIYIYIYIYIYMGVCVNVYLYMYIYKYMYIYIYISRLMMHYLTIIYIYI